MAKPVSSMTTEELLNAARRGYARLQFDHLPPQKKLFDDIIAELWKRNYPMSYAIHYNHDKVTVEESTEWEIAYILKELTS